MYRVTAKYITVKTQTPDGIQVRGLHEGAPVPLDVDQDSIDHHLAQGLIEEIPTGETVPTVQDADARVKAAQQAVKDAEAQLKDAESDRDAAEKAEADREQQAERQAAADKAAQQAEKDAAAKQQAADKAQADADKVKARTGQPGAPKG